MAEAAGAVLQAIYPVGRHDKQTGESYPEKTVILRFHALDTNTVVAALEAAGFPVKV